MGIAPPRPKLSGRQLLHLQATVDAAMESAARVLSEMSGELLEVRSSAIEIVPLAQVATAAGSPEVPALGVYVCMQGDGEGYLLLLLDEPMACELAALMLGVPVESLTLADELAASALAEAGNVACSSFMNAVAEATGLVLHATPPVVVDDMRGAIMDVAVADIAMLGDEALLIETEFLPSSPNTTGSPVVDARLLAIPTPDTLTSILDRLARRAMAG